MPAGAGHFCNWEGGSETTPTAHPQTEQTGQDIGTPMYIPMSPPSIALPHTFSVSFTPQQHLSLRHLRGPDSIVVVVGWLVGWSH